MKPGETKKALLRNQEGQATVEFALTMILLLSFVLFYIQLSLVFAWGNFAHYATFMSARAYLASGPDPGEQADRAKAVIEAMVKKGQSGSSQDRLPMVARGIASGPGGDGSGIEIGGGSQFNASARNLSWMEGVRYTFKSRLFLIPFGRPDKSANKSANSVTLTSESWLGREPSYKECLDQLGKKHGIIDNGC